MAKELSFENYQPQPFCKWNCPHMDLDLNSSGTLIADSTIYERVVQVSCSNEAVCKAARAQMRKECIDAIDP